MATMATMRIDFTAGIAQLLTGVENVEKSVTRLGNKLQSKMFSAMAATQMIRAGLSEAANQMEAWSASTDRSAGPIARLQDGLGNVIRNTPLIGDMTRIFDVLQSEISGAGAEMRKLAADTERMNKIAKAGEAALGFMSEIRDARAKASEQFSIVSDEDPMVKRRKESEAAFGEIERTVREKTDAIKKALGPGVRTDELIKQWERWEATMKRTEMVKLSQDVAENAEKMAKEWADAQAAMQAPIDATINSLQEQVDTFDMSAAAATRYKLSAMGASEADIALAVGLQDYMDKLTAMKAMQDEAASIFEATRTPMERYENTIERLSELLNSGALDWDTYGRAVRDAREQLEKAARQREPITPGAIENRALQAAPRQKFAKSDPLSQMAKDQREQTAAQKKANEVLGKIEKNTRDFDVVEIDL